MYLKMGLKGFDMELNHFKDKKGIKHVCRYF